MSEKTLAIIMKKIGDCPQFIRYGNLVQKKICLILKCQI